MRQRIILPIPKMIFDPATGSFSAQCRNDGFHADAYIHHRCCTATNSYRNFRYAACTQKEFCRQVSQSLTRSCQIYKVLHKLEDFIEWNCSTQLQAKAKRVENVLLRLHRKKSRSLTCRKILLVLFLTESFSKELWVAMYVCT